MDLYGERMAESRKSSLRGLLRKVRVALLRRGVAYDEVEDLVQEAFLKVEQYERSQSVRSREAMVMKVAVNLSIDKARREARAPFAVSDDVQALADLVPNPEEIVREQLRLQHAAKGLDSLPERTRRILLLRRLEGFKYDEIAEREGMSVAAVEKRVARAMLKLMEWMDGW